MDIDLKQLAETAQAIKTVSSEADAHALNAFWRAVTPEVVLELIAENKRLKSDLRESEDLVEHLQDKRAELKQEVEALRKDAARYRYLRDDISAGKVDLCIVQKDWRGGDIQWLSLEQADYKIDAAMRKETGQ